uniref:Uncharacterized protein n=1 Tax=Pyricularia oryzae (strain P131) TaxID=1143193 RepID=L7J5J1_PYRO1
MTTGWAKTKFTRRSKRQALRLEAFFHKGESWRRMLVQQPACEKLGFIQQTGGSGDQQSFASALQQFPICDASADAGEVRMGSHYDLVYRCHGPCLSGQRMRQLLRSVAPLRRRPAAERVVQQLRSSALQNHLFREGSGQVCDDPAGKRALCTRKHIPTGGSGGSIPNLGRKLPCYHGRFSSY